MGGLNHEVSTREHGQEPDTPADSPPSTGGSETLESRLVGRLAPDIQLQYAHEAWTSLAALARVRSLVVFFYPGTDTPRDGQSVGLDEQRAVRWARHDDELVTMKYEVIAVSAQSAIEQARFASRDPLPYVLLSDPGLDLADLLGLPTIGRGAERAYEPLTLVVRDQHIVQVLYPVDPDCETGTIMRWIRDSAQ
jgi:peroxiredoxin